MPANFTPERLTLARERRGMSIAGLARKSGVAERAIRDHEKGNTEPREASVQALADALAVPVEFFFGSPLEALGENAASFRAATKLPKRRRDAALAAGSFAMLFAEFMAERFVLPHVEIPELDAADPELAADSLRAEWRLGLGPAPNLVHLLESKGVLVFALAEDCRELDAFSFWRLGRPFVMLNTMKSAERSRTDAAHELGHLVLHRDVERLRKEHEAEAQVFAASFLLPRRAVLASGVRGASLAQVLDQRSTWRVAATAYARRLHELGMLTDWQYRSLMIELSKRGYRSGEPGGHMREGSQLMQIMLRELRSDGTGLRQLARELSLNIDDVRQLVLGLAPIRAV